MDRLLLRPSEVGEIIGMGRSKTYELIRRQEIPSVRLGSAIRVPAHALREWVEALAAEEAGDAG